MSDKKEVVAKTGKKQQPKKPGFFARIGRGLSNIGAELKKVVWPKFPTVLKQTGVVIGVVCLFLVLITAFDLGLQFLLTKIVG